MEFENLRCNDLFTIFALTLHKEYIEYIINIIRNYGYIR